MSKSMVKVTSASHTDDLAMQTLDLARSMCENLPNAIAASEASTNAYLAANCKEIELIDQILMSGNLSAEERNQLWSRRDARRQDIDRKDIQNKSYGLGLAQTIVGGVAVLAVATVIVSVKVVL